MEKIVRRFERNQKRKKQPAACEDKDILVYKFKGDQEDNEMFTRIRFENIEF